MKALCSADQNDAAEEFFGWGAIWLGDLDPSANDLNEPDSLIGSREALRAQQSCAYEVRFDGLGRHAALRIPLARFELFMGMGPCRWRLATAVEFTRIRWEE